MEAFSQGTIDNLSELFGRTNLITKLRKYAERQDNVNLVGSRRSGKTCVLTTLKSTIKLDPNSNVYPFYIDIKESGIKGNTCAVYRYIVSILVSDLNKDGIWADSDLTISGVTFQSHYYYEDIYEDPVLCAQSSNKMQSIFNNLVKKINTELGKTVLILFDEYEKLMKYAFDEPSGFYRMRNMVNDRTLSFTFIVAGHEKWDKVISKLGSGELNVVNVEEPIIPLNAEEFHDLWQYECSKISDQSLRDIILCKEEFAYEKSGGIPFFGKCIGAYLVVNRDIEPTYFDISLDEIVSSLDRDEKIILQKMERGEVVQLTPPLESLRIKGLVVRDGDCYRITMGFMKDVIRSADYVDQLRRSAENPCQKLAMESVRLVETINATRKNKGYPYTFEPVNDSGSLEEDLRTLCTTKTDFEDFCAALYRNHFERSKDRFPKDKLPNKCRTNQFVQVVDVMRHAFGGHERDGFVPRDDWMTLPEALMIVHGSSNEPYSADDFSKMQETMLGMYTKELTIILKKAQDDTWSE